MNFEEKIFLIILLQFIFNILVIINFEKINKYNRGDKNV